MKKLLLYVMFSFFIAFAAKAQVEVSLVNPSFELPVGGAKISNPNDMDGWHCDTSTGTDSGRETDAGSPDGTMRGFSRNSDGRIYQAIGKLTADKTEFSYTIKSTITWNPNPRGFCETTFSVMDEGAAFSTRMVVNTLSTEIFNSGYTQITHNYVFDTGHSYGGKVLVIEYAFTTDGPQDGWAGFDDIHVTKNIFAANTAPTNIQLSSTSISEGTTQVGTISAVDPDLGATLTYALTSGTGDTDNALFEIKNSNELHLKAAAVAGVNFSIRLKATDNNGATAEQDFAIHAVAVNHQPTDISISSLTVQENVAPSTVVGTLSATDADATDTFIFSMAAGDGVNDADNAAFTILAKNLSIKATPNFEAKPSYSIHVKVTDGGGLSYTKAFVIAVNNENEKPSLLALSNLLVNENVASASVVGTLSATDQDAGDVITYSLATGNGTNDADNVKFTLTGNSLSINASPDFEVKPTYHIFVKVADVAGLFVESAFVITVKNVNEAPVNLTLSSTKWPEESLAGQLIGNFSASDPDAGDVLTYALVAGDGIKDADNVKFVITGNQLKTTVKGLDYEITPGASFRIFVQVSDVAGLSSKLEVTITLSDINQNSAPTGVTLSAITINEQVASGSVVAKLTAVDVDAADTHTFELVAGDGKNDVDNAKFLISDGNLVIQEIPNFEVKSVYLLNLKVSDASTSVFAQLNLSVNDLNEAPANLALSNSTLPENKAIGTEVGLLTATDEDAVSTLTYSLVAGDGTNDADNGKFAISGTKLVTAKLLDFEAQSAYKINILVTDGTESITKTFVVNVTDEIETSVELNNTMKVSVYPNPVKSVLTVSGFEGDGQVSIYTVSGSLVKKANLYSGESTIDFSGFKKGLYILEIRNSKDQVYKTTISK